MQCPHCGNEISEKDIMPVVPTRRVNESMWSILSPSLIISRLSLS